MTIRTQARPLIVGITGGSGAGKTTLCQGLLARLGASRCLLISQDDYYRDQRHVPERERHQINFDDPAVVDGPLLANHIRALRDCEPVQVPIYDFRTHTRTSRFQTVSPVEIILLEGILLFQLPDVGGLCDVKVFVDTPEQERNDRRVVRDVRERGRTLQSVISQINEQVLPMHRIHVEPQKRAADLVVSGCGALEENIVMVVAMMERLKDASSGRALVSG